MKRIRALIVAAGMTVTLCSCGNGPVEQEAESLPDNRQEESGWEETNQDGTGDMGEKEMNDAEENDAGNPAVIQ